VGHDHQQHVLFTRTFSNTGLQSFCVWAYVLFPLNTQPARSLLRQVTPFWQGLEPSPQRQGRSPQGTATPGKRWCESGTAPRGVTRQDGACPRALGPNLKVAACRPVWVVTPSGKTWRPSKEEQSQTKSSALHADIHRHKDGAGVG
jgi:hypothetical protein